MILSLETISKSFGAAPVLEAVTARIEDRDRIGLVGPNGAGKSTLLNIIVGDLEADAGTLSRADKPMGFLRQDSGLTGENSIITEMRSVFADLYAIESDMRALEATLSGMDHSDPEFDELSAKYAGMQTDFESREGYLIDVKISKILGGMGFLGVDTDMQVGQLSGGEKTRLALCKLLLEEPDLLILDEPTNHLDFKTLLWLEDYLKSYKGALLIVSHDRYFLDQLCTSIWSLSHHRLDVYSGNYSRYIDQREERYIRQFKEYQMQQEEIAEMKDFIARNIVRASTTARAQSRQKALDRMELVPKPHPPEKQAKLRFEYKREPVKDVLLVESLSLSVGDGGERKQLCKGVDFSMMRGEKIALIGLNGVGKSTFLKALLNMHEADEGDIWWGKNTDLSYFEQGDSTLHREKTALDEMWDRFPRLTEHNIRTVLGNVGITGENIYKRVGQLSGGERAKLKFALLTLSCGNVLIMDEPTNHLDLTTKEALDAALRSYTGTLLIVSHDRYLLDKVPDKIVEMYPDRFVLYPGNYDAYKQHKQSEAALQNADAGAGELKSASPSPAGASYRGGKKQRSQLAAARTRVKELEALIEALEVEIFGLENDIQDPELAKDYKAMQDACDALADKKLELSDALAEWTELSEHLEEQQ